MSTAGAEGSRAFVLVPGTGVTSNCSERLALRLNELGPVIALDLPGFGGVPHPGRPMTVVQYAELVGRVVDQLGLEDPVLVGTRWAPRSSPASRPPGTCPTSS